MLKVGILSDVFYPYLLGGGENRYYEIAQRLVASGDEVIVLTTALRGEPNYEEPMRGLKIYRGGLPPHPLTHRSLLSVPGYVTWTFKAMRLLEGCDILDLNTYASAITGLVLARILRKPAVVTIHDVFSSSWLNGHNIVYGFLGSLSERLIALLNRNGVFMTVSEASKQKLVSKLGIKRQRVYVVPNGIDFTALKDIGSYGKNKKRPRHMVYVGRLIGYKNVGHLFYALRELEKRGLNISLDVIGSGAESANLKALSKKLGLDERVRFRGFVRDKSEVYQLMSQAGVLVNPSYFEGFSMVLLEALALGTPIVAYNLKAYGKFLINGVNCFLVPKGNITSLTDAIEMIFTDDRIARRFSSQGVKMAKEFDWTRIVSMIRSVYERLV